MFEGNGDKAKKAHTVLTHICTEEDWKKFHKPAKKDQGKFDKLRSRGVMQCLNDRDIDGNKINNNIFGPDDGRPHRRIDIIFSPCQEGETADCINKKSDN